MQLSLQLYNRDIKQSDAKADLIGLNDEELQEISRELGSPYNSFEQNTIHC
jgi:hypothetical protein